MSKLSLEELNKLKENKKNEITSRKKNNITEILVGMGTCGIAAGAKETFDTFVAELENKKIESVFIQQTGCMGLCYSEPTVEIKVPDMPTIIYGNVDSETAKKIVTEHIGQKKLLDNHIFDKPSVDIVDNK